MDALGYEVESCEPDPLTYDILKDLLLNNTRNVKAINAGVSNADGMCQFTRVCGNTMSSHITGSKSKPYGKLETIDINIVNANRIFKVLI